MERSANRDTMVRPIGPDEVAEYQVQHFPDEVFETVNELLSENVNRGYARIMQGDIVKRLVQKGLNRGEIFKRGWLNFEEIYRDAGWDVSYDKPGYNESYEANFTFKAAKNRRSRAATGPQWI